MAQEAWVDLHVHTSCSDGLLSPARMVALAKEAGLKAVGIADHDTVDGLQEAFRAGVSMGVEVVPGVELSSQFQKLDLHILGYYFDPDHPRLQEHLSMFRDERYRRAVKMVDRLREMGISISFDDVMERAGGCCVGRPHIAEVLMENGYVETFQEAFNKFIGYGGKAYVEKYKLSPEEAIALIADSGGLSFLAHPGPLLNDRLIRKLIKDGLNGIEVLHPNLSDDRSAYLQRIVREYGLLMSGGSDCHGGREGHMMIGRCTIPYALLEQIKQACVSCENNQNVITS